MGEQRRIRFPQPSGSRALVGSANPDVPDEFRDTFKISRLLYAGSRAQRKKKVTNVVERG
jgi:hypothetical protein